MKCGRDFDREAFFRLMKHIPEATIRAAETSSLLEQFSKVDSLISALQQHARGEHVSAEVLEEAHQLARAYAESKQAGSKHARAEEG